MAATAPIVVHRLSFPATTVVALLFATVSGVWYLAGVLAEIHQELFGRVTTEEFEGHDERLRSLEGWRIEHQVRHPSFPVMTDEDRD